MAEHTGAEEYEGLTPHEVWSRICENTGVRERTMKLGGDMTWQDLAGMVEAIVGLALHERNQAASALVEVVDRLEAWMDGEKAALTSAEQRGDRHAAEGHYDTLTNYMRLANVARAAIAKAEGTS